ncbi:MAG TPA: LTA synthase family protein [Dyella sp.]|uniref:LTA synthase family protein n=1 Tax=Dyella sp. TaxID=1869338 RepID=UPI002B684502|nr:LTA synthase family protein [Dyella sp.]HTV85944.1 LTA synthase family protein [Dyella sp.]
MILPWLAKTYRAVFFLGLLVAYVLVLYLFATPTHDDAFMSCVRFAAPAIELACAWLICDVLLALARRRGSRLALGLPWAVALTIALVYAAQIYSIYLSGNFISVLAIQNRAESRIVRNATMYMSIALAVAWWLVFVVGQLCEQKLAAASDQDNVAPLQGRTRLAIAVLLGLSAALLFQRQHDTGMLEVGYTQSPVITFVRNVFDSTRSVGDADRANSLNAPSAAPSRERFPLEKSLIYDTPLPYQAKGVAGTRPNVIVIFSEGVSARLLGCYGGKYPGLTPNIDRLASVSMRVIDYYNHTAATYRGLRGQMVSGYPQAGGDDDKTQATDAATMASLSIQYRSVPMMLKQEHYNTYFISPHYNRVGLNDLLRSLGFDKVYSFEDVSRTVLPGNKLYYVEGALSDDDEFGALRALMTRGELNGKDRPFFMGLYNFGTHAFIDIMPNGAKYGDGGNSALNKLHNFDHALGAFLDYFFASPYAKNTILVLTADHATYPDQDYRAVAGDGYKPLLVDRIPLIIYDPTHKLPAILDARARTSIDLAPTLMQLLGIQKETNSFLGTSLFEPTPSLIGMAAIGDEFFATDPAGVYPEADVPEQYKKAFLQKKQLVERYYQLEAQNRLFPTIASPSAAETAKH